MNMQTPPPRAAGAEPNRRKPRRTPKGRQVDLRARDDVCALLGDRPRAERPASNLVFLIDVSGSMQPDNKLPLVKSALRLLIEELDERDRVALVVYAGNSGVVQPSTPCTDRAALLTDPVRDHPRDAEGSK